MPVCASRCAAPASKSFNHKGHLTVHEGSSEQVRFSFVLLGDPSVSSTDLDSTKFDEQEKYVNDTDATEL